MQEISGRYVSESLGAQGFTIKTGEMRRIVFPELRKLNIGDSVERRESEEPIASIRALLHDGSICRD